MRLLIVTQAIDRKDLSLGFFHAWAEEFAHRVDSLEIICLKRGDYDLPDIGVHSLGKESARGSAWYKRAAYTFRFWRLIIALRSRYDTVFVHMNDEYVILGWLLWKIMEKRIGLWRNHVQGSWRAAIACRLAGAVFYTSPNTYATRFQHAYRMPTGIEVEKYAFSGDVDPHSILSLGRIDPVKKVGELLEGLKLLVSQGVPFRADIYGTPTQGRESYAKGLGDTFEELKIAGVLVRYPGVPHQEVPALFGSHRIFVNLTPPGSFDKTVFEAMAAGCLVVAANPGIRDIIGEAFFVPELTPQAIGGALRNALKLPDAEYRRQRDMMQAYVVREHSLKALVQGVVGHLKSL